MGGMLESKRKILTGERKEQGRETTTDGGQD